MFLYLNYIIIHIFIYFVFAGKPRTLLIATYILSSRIFALGQITQWPFDTNSLKCVFTINRFYNYLTAYKYRENNDRNTQNVDVKLINTVPN